MKEGFPPPTVAALYVEKDGAYAGIDGVQVWDESKDARRYGGPFPVVAHPPCQLWGNLALVNYARWGGEHNRPKNDGGKFAAALNSVREWGGVLEHPQGSRAFVDYGIVPDYGQKGWQRLFCGGWVCEVWQSAYGHRANKATWLYYAGTLAPPQMRWERKQGSHQVGGSHTDGYQRNEKPTLSQKEANATPPEFRDALLFIARRVTRPPHLLPWIPHPEQASSSQTV